MYRRVGIVLAVIATVALPIGIFGVDSTRPNYPATRSESISEQLHGQSVPDPYRWLEDSNSSEVKDWTEKQNNLTRIILDQFPGRDKLRTRLDQLLEIGTLSAPKPAKGKYFYTRREGKQNQPVLYVRDGVNGSDRALLDVNALSADGTVALDWYFPSDDGKLLAYGLSASGNEMSTLRVRDVATGKDLPDVIDRCRACSLAWFPKSDGFYYTRYPAPNSVPKGEETYHRRTYLHKLGSDPASDPLIFGEGRPKEDWPNLSLSPNGHWLTVTQQQGWAKTEVYIADTTREKLEFKTLAEGISAIFHVEAADDAIFVRTNQDAPRYKMYRVDPTKLDRKEWNEIIPEGPDVLEQFAIAKDTLAVMSMQKASSRLRLYDHHGKSMRDVALPTLGSVTGLAAEQDGRELFFGFHSFVVPPRAYRVDLTSGKTALWAGINADIDFDAFEVKQVEYPSKDGTPITMFLAAKKGIKHDGNNPTVLYGYGGFNISLTPSFSQARFAFLERGGVLAIANLRGGGEYGEAWHQAGMLGKKQNVFDDFIAAAEWLIREKITSPEKLAIQGGSNGGLLVGAVLTQRPELFRAVVCAVPLLDMVRYHQRLIARLWIPEYGSSESSEQFEWLRRYSPYHHVRDGVAYPATLFTAAESDTRVDPMHARKMAAILQKATSSNRPILLRLETKAGHGAGKPRSKTLDELTDVYSFLFSELSMTP
ncbi:MAG: prolyl oligopeptidase family serine peptidase [Gemmataceae bacterium]